MISTTSTNLNFLEILHNEKTQTLRLESIIAVRCADAIDQHLIPTRVIIEYSLKDRSNVMILNCDTDEERNKLAANISKAITGREAPDVE